MLGIPRGGIVIAAVLARELGGELDVVLARKLRAPYQPELALGAVAEDGSVYLDDPSLMRDPRMARYLEEERQRQMAVITERRASVRAIRPEASMTGRSVIVTDDGIATGSTMIAALKLARARGTKELIAAAPVAPRDRVAEIAALCDEFVCVLTPEDFQAIGQFYQRFEGLDESEFLATLRDFAPRA